ncbi:MAG: DUF5050 domain-containing protein [Dehalococcoidia bacterium]
MSYCTQHPGKEAVGACSECGHLVCKACYTEVKDRVYCTSCANKLFTVKEQPPSPPVAGEKKAQPAQKPVEAKQPVVPPQSVPLPPPPPPPSPPPPSPAPLPKVELPPAAEVKPAADVPPVIEKPIIKPPDAPKKQPAAATAPPKGLSVLWWLAPVLLAFIGGLLAWFSNKSREPGKARAMLWTGIGLTAVYAAVIFVFAIMPGIQAGSSERGTIIFDSYRDGTWQVWVMNPDGSDPELFTAHDNTSKYYSVQSSWSAKLKKLFFCTSRDKNNEIYSIDADVSNDTNLTKSNFNDLQPDWSDSSKKVAFISNPEGNSEIYVMDADGGNLQRLTVSKPNDQRPRWSPAGDKIVFSTDRDGNFEIYAMDAAGSNQLRLTTSEGWDGQARWSPDGKRIAFVSERDGNPEIYTMDADGKNQKRVTFNSAKDYYPCFSPNGTKIVYHSNIAGNDDIYIMNTDGGNQNRLTDDKANDQIPLWISEKLKPPAETTPPAVRAKILGSELSTSNMNSSGKDNAHYVQFVADQSGSIDVIRVYSSEAGSVKAAIYDHGAATGRPLNKLSSNDQPTTCAADQWNTVYIPAVPIEKGKTYWLAFNTDTTGVVMNGAGTQQTFYLKAIFDGFTFPASAPSDNGTIKLNASICGYGNP